MGGELTDILVYRIIFNAIESERVTDHLELDVGKTFLDSLT